MTQFRSDRHNCELIVEEHGGLARLPPNAPCFQKCIRWLRNRLSLNPNLSITDRNFRNRSQKNAERRRHARSKYFYIIHPYSDMEVVREIFYLIIGTWKIITAPFIASFSWTARNSNLPGHSKQDIRDFVVLEQLANGLFIMDIIWIISCFFTGYKEGYGKNAIQLNQLKIAKRYVLSYFFIDVVALSPYIENDYIWNILTFANLVVLLRLPTVIKFMKRFLLDLKLHEIVISGIYLVYISTILVHVFSCLFYLLPFVTYDPNTRIWLVEVKEYPDKPIMIEYFACYILVQAHFWGLGEPSKGTENPMEEFVLIMAMIVGRLWSLYIIATMLRVFTISSLSESKYEQYLMQLQTFISHSDLPKDMEERLLEYYEYRYQHHYFNEKAIFSALSDYLRQEVMLFRAKNVISKVHIFKYFPRSMIASIIGKCKILVFMNNDYVVKAGDKMDHVYFISSGTIAVFNKDKYELYHLTDGDDIGMRGVISYLKPNFMFTYVSIETTEVYAIHKKDFREIVYSKPDILRYFQRRVEERIALWAKIESIATAQGLDLLSALNHERVLERPRIRTRLFER